MKKQLQLILTLLLGVLATTTYGQLQLGEKFTIDNIEYRVISTSNKEVQVFDYLGPGGAVEIPGIVFSGIYTVTRIGQRAFQDNQLTSVTLPNSVTGIGRIAFHGNQLTEVIIPENVTEIGSNAFSQNDMTEVTIPKNVTEIGSLAFNSNPITKVTALGTDIIPTIADDTFSNSIQINLFVSNRNQIDLIVPQGKIQDYLDNGWTGFKSINETITFTIDPIAAISIDENTAYTGPVPTLSGDTPIGSVTYTLGGTDAGLFTIDPTTGQVGMIARDFEAPVDANTDNVYELSITATDDDSNSASQAWTVTIEDVNETITFTIDPIAAISIDENTAYTGPVPTLSGDTPVGNLTYTLGGTDAGLFTIDPTTGQVNMIPRDFEAPVDANTDNIYELSITATDQGSNSSNSEAWTVTIEDVNETITFTIDPIAAISIDENTAYTGPVPTLSGDTPVGNLTYTLGGTDAGSFTIDPVTGQVGMIARDYEVPVDANTDNIYELSITATDDNSNSASQAWTVAIEDVNETVTFTIDPIADASIDENTAYTGPVPTLSGDTPVGNLTYTLGGTDAGSFSIDPATGQVSMVARDFEAPVDANTDNIYELSITATDQGSNSASEDWTVTIEDVNETISFTIDPIAAVTIDENTAYTGPVPTLSGDTPMGNLTYTLGGTDAGSFTIDPATGQVGMIARDYEAPVDANTDNIYELSITATDQGSNSASEDWTVTIEDVNETVTFTIDPIAAISIAENTAYTGPVPTLSGDTPVGNLTYTLGGTDAGSFTIDPATGQVGMIARDFEAPVDANTDNIYELSITATDQGSNSSNSEAWTVTIEDVNETVTFTIDPIAAISIDENTAYTGPVPTLSGDTPMGNLTYTLGGTDAGSFSIDPATGQVSMVARDFEAPVDANTDNIYELSITATDDGSNSASEDWTVTIEDVNETISFTIDPIAAVTIDENTAYTGPVPTLSGDTPVGNLTYTLGGTDAGLFTIDPVTGQVGMIARDFEAPVDANTDNIYELSITATDDDTNSASQAWTVTIEDVNETISFTIDPIAAISIDENTAYTGPVPTLSGDTPVGNLTYTLGGTDAGLFTIDPVTGQVGMIARDFEAPVDANTDNIYELSITATDDGSNSASQAWTVTIEDVNETVTFTIDPIAAISIDENTAYTGPVPTLSGDTPVGNLTYTLGGTDAGLFTIDPATGQVSMVARDFEAPVDANTDNIYELSITATDDGSNSASQAWTVTIEDANETVTFTIDPIANATIAENTAYTGPVPTLSGDTPVGNLTYTLGGTDAGLFTIDPATGQVSMIPRDFEAPVDANTDNIYELSITATDDGSNSDSQAWTVTIEDVNETVSFTIDPIAATSIAENTAYTGPVPTLSGDTPVGNLTYTLGGPDAGLFTIDPATGQVSMIARDFENPQDANTDNIYELSITATDQGSNSASQAWTVTIEDVNETVSFTIDPIANATIAENTAYTGPVPTLSGDTPVGNLTYTLGGTDAGLFTIDPATGQVSMVARDFEAPVDANTDNVYELSITATDDGSNSASQAWTVTIEDVNETISFTIDAIADTTIAENTAYTGPVPTLSGDTPVGNLTYTLGGTDAGSFTIDPVTGQVGMIARDFEAPVDANTDNIYELSITATDDGSNSASQAWTVTIEDVNETISFTIDPIADATIAENTAYTGPVPTLSGDTPVGNLTYTLGGTDAGSFTIDPATGQVSMIARDFENPQDANTDNVYELSITATDDGSNSASQAWTVTIEDVNETISFTIDPIANATIAENTAYTGPVPTLSGDTPVGNLTYTLGGTDAGSFTIDPVTGQVGMVARDFEAPVDANTDNIYELSITATDDGSNSASQAWTVTIQDVNETVTFTIDPIADTTIAENTAYTGPVPTLSGDTPVGNLTYTLGGTDAGSFTIDPVTGQVSMVARDFEAPVDANTDNIYELNITATDDDTNSASQAWTVTIQDVNEIANDALRVLVMTPSCTGSADGSVEVIMDASGYLMDILIEGDTMENRFLMTSLPGPILKSMA